MATQRQLPDLIGNTPLVYLREVSELTGCSIYGKAEFMNPGGSVKDRTGLGIIRAAEASGELQPGGVIVEGTAGNTGIGLTLVANALGYESVIVMPQTASQEKINHLEMLGAELLLVPAVPYSDPEHYIHQAETLPAVARPQSPRERSGRASSTTSPTGRFITTLRAWKSGSRPGARWTGSSARSARAGHWQVSARPLRERNPDVKIGLVDPMGSALFSHYTSGELKAEGSSIAEGIGVSFLPGNLDGVTPDFCCQVDDDEALPYVYNLLKHEGVSVGGSAGINIGGAVALARELGPGHTIVTILCDSGSRYQSKLFNPEFLWERKLPYPEWVAS